ncbi:DUF1178 family protein [Marivibrio halodurans]|uniref:DUF1178 family protein n=1 Tax=Marivibrio halodurans TaxID=2039722 RepID=A0A8J7V2Z5_9PROT|nr:DUF1178 family protein [Marivibrio halodurans]MBP5857397.1 DUF1178 family protein [Marivibrio halodurans]
MISFNLRCSKDHEFEGWFHDSTSFEKDLKRRRIECPVCGDSNLERALSAPNIASSEQRDAARRDRDRAMRETLRAFRRHVETNAENVGERFAEEARRIHYGETEKRAIYGEASADETRDLVEEGVPVAPIPWIEEAKDN